MSKFFWPNYIDVADSDPGEEELEKEIKDALNELSHVPEFRELLREYGEQNILGLLIIPGNGFSSETDGFSIRIDQNDATAQFMGLDGQFHEFTLEMLILHEVAHSVNSYLLPDPGATEFDQIEHINDHRRQINQALRSQGLDPIRTSDTDEQKLLKAMQAEEIRVINFVNDVRKNRFPDLPLRDPTAHQVIDPSKIKIDQGEPGWEEAENKSRDFIPEEDRISSEDIRQFLIGLSPEDMKQIFNVDVEGYDNFELTYLWQLANENDPDSDMNAAEYRRQFTYSFGRVLIDSPELAEKIFEAYEKSQEQASYTQETGEPTEYAMNDQNGLTHSNETPKFPTLG